MSVTIHDIRREEKGKDCLRDRGKGKGKGKEDTSSKKGPLSPVHSKHTPCPKTHALGKVNTPPEIHSQNATTKVHSPKVKHRGVTDIRQTAEMLVLESFVDGFVEVTVVDLVRAHARQCGGDLGELVAEIQTLLVSALGGGGEGGEFGIDLV